MGPAVSCAGPFLFVRPVSRLSPAENRSVHVYRTQAAAAGGLAQRLDLVPNGRLILRQRAGEVGYLLAEQRADPANDREGENDDDHDRWDATGAPAAQLAHRWREDEGQKDRERERQEHRLAEIKRGDDGEHRQDGKRAGRDGFRAQTVS